MYQLNDTEVETVSNWLNSSQLRNHSLGQELLDHICCTIEAIMDEDTPLATAYQQALSMVCPNGAREIEEETFFLLTYNKQVNMKRVLFSTGFLSTFLLSFGFLFKLMHWPFASIILTCGLAVLFIALGALLVNMRYTLQSLSTPMRIRTITGLVCGLLIVTGSLFKILHYPGASMLLVVGLVLLNMVFLPMFFYQLYRKSVIA